MDTACLAGEVAVLARQLEKAVFDIQTAIKELDQNTAKARMHVEKNTEEIIGQVEGVACKKHSSLMSQLQAVCEALSQLKYALSNGDVENLKNMLEKGRKLAEARLESPDVPVSPSWPAGMWSQCSESLPSAVEEYGDEEQQLSHKQLSSHSHVVNFSSQPRLRHENWLLRPLEQQQGKTAAQAPPSVLRQPTEENYRWLLKPQHGTHRPDSALSSASLRTWLADIQRAPEDESFEVLSWSESDSVAGSVSRRDVGAAPRTTDDLKQWLVPERANKVMEDTKFEPFKDQPIEFWLNRDEDSDNKEPLFEPFYCRKPLHYWLVQPSDATEAGELTGASPVESTTSETGKWLLSDSDHLVERDFVHSPIYWLHKKLAQNSNHDWLVKDEYPMLVSNVDDASFPTCKETHVSDRPGLSHWSMIKLRNDSKPIEDWLVDRPASSKSPVRLSDSPSSLMEWLAA